jgi:hypothetical protein
MRERLKVPVGDAISIKKYEDILGDDEKKSTITKFLIYLGQDGKRFTLGHREFVNNSIRHAFHENPVYQNPSPGETTDIAYQDMRFRVFSVSNTCIEFELLEREESVKHSE